MRDSDLDDLFGAARQQPVTVSADLMARVLSDAEALQPRTTTSRRAKPAGGFWAGIFAAIGGAGGLAGLSTAALAGIWIGFAQPLDLSTVTDAIWADETVAGSVNILPGFDDFLSEG